MFEDFTVKLAIEEIDGAAKITTSFSLSDVAVIRTGTTLIWKGTRYHVFDEPEISLEDGEILIPVYN